jgi:hypothetical protein
MVDPSHRALAAGISRLGEHVTEEVREVARRRRANSIATSARRHLASGASDVSFSTSRPRDPLFYWRNNNLPFDFRKPDQMVLLRQYCRDLYQTHPVIGSAIDIYSRYPLIGMELVCKDERIKEFYEQLFFSQLNYEDFLVKVGREYWTVGEAWPLGSFDDDLGVWDEEELINPNDVDVVRSPFLREPRFLMRIPEVIRVVLETRTPLHEYEAIVRNYPELAVLANRSESRMAVSNILLRQIKYEADTFFERGVPILLRAMRPVLQEEMLNAAQDAIADRLSTPLILAKLGASATDLGTKSPWIPGPEDLDEFEAALDAALAADFRVLTHNFAVDLTHVFGRETMPNFDADFDRLTERQLQAFGMSKTMISGADRGETYAADALNRDLVTQLLVTFQRTMQRHFRERALVVAEAQEHYDYETRGGKIHPIMEEVVEIDADTGVKRIVERPKLLVPELKMRTMNLHDEQAERDMIEQFRASGMPISQRTRLTNIPIDLSDEVDAISDEQIEQAVANERVRKATYQRLLAEGLKIPEDLMADYGPKALTPGASQDNGASDQPNVLPTIGLDDPTDTAALVPTPDDVQMIRNGDDEQPSEQGKPVVLTLPRNKFRPPESDEQREGMPRAAGLDDDDKAFLPVMRGPMHMRRKATYAPLVQITE